MTRTQDVNDAVAQELNYDPLVDATDITVKNMNGDVALNGTVTTYPQYTEAAAAARRVAGHRRLRPPGRLAGHRLTVAAEPGKVAPQTQGMIHDAHVPTVRRPAARQLGSTD
jgi:hypothetical protein